MAINPRRFQKKVENFRCLWCHASIEGDGYTNHCPFCLYSSHVDNNPGDRASFCHGLMPPVSVRKNGDSYDLLHRCDRCGHTKWNKISPADDMDAVIKLMDNN